MRFTSGLTGGGLITAGLALGAVLAGLLVSGGTMFTPGPLSAKTGTGAGLGGVASHAALGGRCTACHASFRGGQPMSNQCLGCHTDIQDALSDSTSLHGSLDDARQCLACHTEHHGPAASLVRPGAGAGDHERLGFSLATHRRTSEGRAFVCGDCHTGGSFKFDRARCESCHRTYQPQFVLQHVQAWGSECLECHEGTDRFTPGRFDHDSTRFGLTGAHQPLKCFECHAGAHTLADFRTALSECLGCHRKDDTHRGEFGTDCGACHRTVAWKPATFTHTFPINHGEAGGVACRTCHEPGRSYSEYTCYGCHEHTPERIARKHSEEGVSGSRLNDCVSCHPSGREHEGGREGGGRQREDDDD